MWRRLTQAERERIAQERPWFGRGRRSANDDLAANEAEIIQFSVRRFWDVNECGPPCCPRALLVQTTDDRFLSLESWTVLPSLTELRQTCVAHRTAVSKMLLAFETAGAVVIAEKESARNSLLDFDAPECEWVDVSDLPVEFRRTAATG